MKYQTLTAISAVITLILFPIWKEPTALVIALNAGIGIFGLIAIVWMAIELDMRRIVLDDKKRYIRSLREYARGIADDLIDLANRKERLFRVNCDNIKALGIANKALTEWKETHRQQAHFTQRWFRMFLDERDATDSLSEALDNMAMDYSATLAVLEKSVNGELTHSEVQEVKHELLRMLTDEEPEPVPPCQVPGPEAGHDLDAGVLTLIEASFVLGND